MRRLGAILLTLACANVPTHVAAEAPPTCPDATGPRGAVMSYLRAMHEHRFEDAFDHVTARMSDGEDRAAWAERQRGLYLPAKVEIYGVDIRGVYAATADPGCETRATVANVLSSRDRLNEHGNVEFEIYHVVATGDGWRIDEQESLYDDSAVRRWFPRAGSYAGGR